MVVMLGVLVGAGVVSGCGSPRSQDTSDARVYAITTSACGDASATTGTGVGVGQGKVLTAAHVIMGSTAVEIGLIGGGSRPATVLAIDAARDLALLSSTDDGLLPVRFVELEVGALAVVQTRSGPRRVTVERALNLDVAEIGGTGRSTRAGFQLNGITRPGDSGAGLFQDDGLAGLVFATTSADDSVTWATAAVELEAFLATWTEESFACDPDRSSLVVKAGGEGS